MASYCCFIWYGDSAVPGEVKHVFALMNDDVVEMIRTPGERMCHAVVVDLHAIYGRNQNWNGVHHIADHDDAQ